MTMMKIFLFISSTLLLLSGCTSLPEKNVANTLHGVWLINHSPDRVYYSVIEYLPTGDKCEISFEWTIAGFAKTIMYWNKWHVEGDMIYTTMYATDGGLEIGLPIHDRILSIEENEFVAIVANYPGEWDPEPHQRVVGAKTGQVCSPVQKALNKTLQPMR